MTPITTFSIPLIRRLPQYHSFVEGLIREGQLTVSSSAIAAHLNLDAIQVRKDIEHIGVIGRPRIGYDARELVKIIAEFLGWNNLNQLILVGCGGLGSALLGYGGFARRNFEIVAGFDTDPVKVGTTIHGKSVLPLAKLDDLCRRLHIEMGIVAVPADHAQEVVDLMIKAGITGIWNFSPAAVNVPKNVVVQQEDIITSLVILQKNIQKQHEAAL
jgi:redox-sensing transcriptional repressor